jgi:hypothetical protein
VIQILLRSKSQLGGAPRTNRVRIKKEMYWPLREQSPRRSAGKHADALRSSDRSVRRLLHRDLRTHPHKMVTARGLSERDCETRTAACCLRAPFRCSQQTTFAQLVSGASPTATPLLCGVPFSVWCVGPVLL